MESNEILKCSRADCDPQLSKFECCDQSYVVKCQCNRSAPDGGSDQEAIKLWNGSLKIDLQREQAKNDN